MATRVIHVDELATLIATHLVAISPRSTLTLAQSCRALEIPALSTLWEIQHSIKLLIKSVLPADAYWYTSKARTDRFFVVGHFLVPLGPCMFSTY